MPDDVVHRYRVRARNADGWGGWGGFAAARVWVDQTHLRPFASPFELVDRQADDFGVSLSVGQRATWANSLTSRQKVTELIDHLASRPERANREKIIRLYFAYFDRAAEPSGLAYWQGRLDSGTAGLG